MTLKPGHIFDAGLRWSGLSWLVRHTVARNRVSILAYHNPEPEVMERHLRWLSRRYSFVSLDDVEQALRGDWSSLPVRPLAITFDDGWAGNFRLLELFRRYGAAPTVFLCSQIVGRPRHIWSTESDQAEALKRLDTKTRLAILREHARFELEREYDGDRQTLTFEEVDEMRGAVRFGSHTRFHPILTTADSDEARREIVASRGEVQELLGEECSHFAYPNGDYGPRELHAVAEAGYRTARTIDIGWNGPHADPHRLKTLGVSDGASINRLAAGLTGVGLFYRWRLTHRWDGRHPVTQPVGSGTPEAVGKGVDIARRRLRERKFGTLVANELILEELERFLEARFARGGRGSVLDLGAGSKPYEPVYREYFATCRSVDVATSPHDISRVDDIASADDLPFEDGSFDCVISTEMLSNCPDPQAVIEEVSRVLRPGGALFLTTPFFVQLYEMPHDYYRFAPPALHRFAEGAGLRVTRMLPRGGYGAIALKTAQYPLSKGLAQVARRAPLVRYDSRGYAVRLFIVAPQRAYLAMWRLLRRRPHNRLARSSLSLTHWTLGYISVFEKPSRPVRET